MGDRRIGEHSIAYGAYLAAMTIALIAAGAWNYGVLYTLLLCTLVWLTYRRTREPNWRNIARECLFFALAMNVSFQAMAGAVPAVRSERYDQILFSLDERIFGGSANVWAERFASPPLTETLSFCYMLFMPLLFFSLARYFFWRRDLLPVFYRGLFTVYGAGFLGYLLVPAAGPYLAFPQLFGVALEGGPITHLNQAMVLAGSNRVDVFPSLHCAVSAYILGFAYRNQRREFWWLLIPVAGLWCSTIYLRYHYLVDVFCGFALALLSLAVARRRPSTQ
jgi:membrane-associated phospholipid phosphatase